MASIIQLVDNVVVNCFEIPTSGLKFGRTCVNQVRIDDLAVSAQHAVIRLLTDEKKRVKYVLHDLNSTNGCFINEQPLIEDQLLRHKDILRIGWNSFTFIDENEIDLEKTRVVKKSWIPGVYYSND